MSKEYEPNEISKVPKTWVERVVRPDVGFADRIKFTAKNIIPASGGFIGNAVMGGDSKGWRH
jgi:hypothetical protein